VIASALAGCKAVPAQQGRGRQITAVYWQGTLWADLPPTRRVQGVVAASDAGLRDRGYAVTAVRSTEDVGRVAAEPQTAGPLESVVVDVQLTDDGTRVAITVKPFGDQARSRAILDAILTRLGL
jgi:hypothetical protein